MEFVADESLDFRIISFLRECVHNVFSVIEECPSISDDAVLELAVTKNSILITEDKDFGELTFRLKKKHQGIFLLKLAGLSIEEKIHLIHSVLNSHLESLPRAFVVLAKNRLRIKK